MTKLSSKQVQILNGLDRRFVLLFEPGKTGRAGTWKWAGGEKANGTVCRGLLHRADPLITLTEGSGSRVARITFAGRNALAEAQKKESGK